MTRSPMEIVREALGAQDDETAADAAKRIVDERDAARAEVERLTATIDGSKTFAAWAAMEREVERLTKERDEADRQAMEQARIAAHHERCRIEAEQARAAALAQLAEVREAAKRVAEIRVVHEPWELREARAQVNAALSASPSAALASVRAAVLEEVAQRFDKLHGCDAPGSRESFGAAFVRSIAEAERVCPCQTDVEDPGPHLPSCPWNDPDYEGP